MLLPLQIKITTYIDCIKNVAVRHNNNNNNVSDIRPVYQTIRDRHFSKQESYFQLSRQKILSKQDD